MRVHVCVCVCKQNIVTDGATVADVCLESCGVCAARHKLRFSDGPKIATDEGKVAMCSIVIIGLYPSPNSPLARMTA